MHKKPEGFTVAEAIAILQTMPQDGILWVRTRCCAGKAISISIDPSGIVGIDSDN